MLATLHATWSAGSKLRTTTTTNKDPEILVTAEFYFGRSAAHTRNQATRLATEALPAGVSAMWWTDHQHLGLFIMARDGIVDLDA